MFINDIHTFIKFLKNQGQNIYHTPEQIDDLVNRASLDLFRQEEKEFEKTQIITDTLGIFKKINTYTLNTNGIYDLPSDYIRATNLTYTYTPQTETVNEEDESEICNVDLRKATTTETAESYESEIDIIEDGKWASVQGSSVSKPTSRYPIARIYSNKLQVLPKTVAPILYYLRKPMKSKWAYTISVDGRSYIFDETNSVDLEWSEISHNEIIEKVISYLGLTLKDSSMSQYEQFQKRNNKEE